MIVDQVELRIIPKVVVPRSLKWEDFEKDYLGEIDPNFHSDVVMAFDFAKRAHKYHPPRESGEPFISHPIMVASYVIEAGCRDISVINACLLHDIPEDDPTYLLEVSKKVKREDPRAEYSWNPYEGKFWLIAKFFGFKTAAITHALTKTNSDETTIKRLKTGPVEGRFVKGCDRLHNLRTMPPYDIPRIGRKIAETKNLYMPLFERAARELPQEGAVLLEEIEKELRLLEARVAHTPLDFLGNL